MLYSQSTSVAEYSLSVIPNRALSSPVLPSILYPLFPIEAYLILLPTILYPLFPTEAYLILLSSILSVIPNRDLSNHSLWNTVSRRRSTLRSLSADSLFPIVLSVFWFPTIISLPSSCSLVSLSLSSLHPSEIYKNDRQIKHIGSMNDNHNDSIAGCFLFLNEQLTRSKERSKKIILISR